MGARFFHHKDFTTMSTSLAARDSTDVSSMILLTCSIISSMSDSAAIFVLSWFDSIGWFGWFDSIRFCSDSIALNKVDIDSHGSEHSGGWAELIQSGYCWGGTLFPVKWYAPLSKRGIFRRGRSVGRTYPFECRGKHVVDTVRFICNTTSFDDIL